MNLRSSIAGFASLSGALSLIGAVFFGPAAFADAPNSLTSYFDNSGFNNTLDTENIVGSGLMTYAGTPVGDGSYDYTSFSELTFSFTFDGGITFSEGDLITDPGATGLKIVIIGSTFQFSAAANGYSGGSAEFVNSAGDYFTFSPSGYRAFAYYLITGGTQEQGYGDGHQLYMGTYGAGELPQPPSSTDIADPEATYLSSGLGTTVNPVFSGGTLTVDEANASYAQNFTVASGSIDTAGETATFSGVFSDADSETPGSLSIVNTGEGGALTLSGASTFTGAFSVGENAAVILAGSIESQTVSIAAGGALNDVNGGLSSTAAVNNAGTFILVANETVGSLVNSGQIAGAGTLTASTYALNDGSVIDANLGAGTLTSNGAVRLNGQSAATALFIETGSLTLGGADRLSHDAIVNIDFNASLVLENGNNTILSLTGGGDVVLLNNSILTLLTGDFSGSASSTGAFEKTGTGVLTLSGANSYQGGTLVQAGKLVVTTTGSLTSDVVVNAAGWLAQNGTVIGNVVNQGLLSGSGRITGNLGNSGVFSPGNSPGVSTVAGNYTESGTLVIEIGGLSGAGVNPAGHDQVRVLGTTTINPGATLTLVKFTAYEPARGDRFTVIDSDGGINGNFSTLDRSAFDTQLYFDRRTGIVYGSGLAEGESFASFNPGNRNAAAVGAALYAAGLTEDSHNTYKAFIDSDTALGSAVVALLTGVSTPATLNALSPEAYAGLSDYGLYVTRNYARQAASASPVSVIDGWDVSVGYDGYRNGTDSSHNDADYSLRSNGAVAGASRAVGRGVTLGGFIAAADGRVGASRLDADGHGYAAGLFAGYLPGIDSRLSLDASAARGVYSFDADRRTPTGLASANDIESKAYSFELNAHYVLLKSNLAKLSALVGTTYAHVDVDGFTEAGPAGLAVRKTSEDLFSGRAGFETQVVATSRLAINAHGIYEHTFSETRRDLDAAFTDGGPSFSVRAPGLGADVLNIGAGASFAITNGLSLGAYYNAGFADNTDVSRAFGGRVNYRF